MKEILLFKCPKCDGPLEEGYINAPGAGIMWWNYKKNLGGFLTLISCRKIGGDFQN